MTSVSLRKARIGDVFQIVGLIDAYAEEGIMLRKTPAAVELALDDFIVAADARGKVLACGALKEYSPSLAEVASVAVAKDAHGCGLGRRIVDAVEQLAAKRGIGEVFALTTTPAFFGALGYEVADRAIYPEKLRRDCAGCARRFACGETCVRRSLAVQPVVALEVAA